MADEFLSIFNGQVKEDSAQDSLKELSKALAEVVAVAKSAKVLVIEVFMLKALKQHRTAREEQNGEQTAKAVNTLRKEIKYVEKNNLGITSCDVTALVWQWAMAPTQGE